MTLGFASPACPPIPRDKWPPLLFHAAERKQTTLRQRAPHDDYEAIYLTISLQFAVDWWMQQLVERKWRQGFVHVIAAEELPDDAQLRLGNEEGEVVLVTCKTERIDVAAVIDEAVLSDAFDRSFPFASAERGLTFRDDFVVFEMDMEDVLKAGGINTTSDEDALLAQAAEEIDATTEGYFNWVAGRLGPFCGPDAEGQIRNQRLRGAALRRAQKALRRAACLTRKR